jgi:hypothetical protein
MAQEIIRLCDPCLVDHGTRADGAPFTVDIGDGPRLLDLCEAHRDELIKPLADALYLYGVKPVGGAPTLPRRRHRSPSAAASARGSSGPKAVLDGAQVCPFCTYTVDAVSAMYRHMHVQHGFTRLQRVMGHQCPLCGDKFSPGGKDNLTAHVLAAHGEPSVSRALLAGRAAGDPYGVDARVQAAAG